MRRQTHLDLTEDSHTQHKEQPQNVARVFPFILKTKHKTLHVKRAWVELEILQKKQSARLWIIRSSQANLHNKSCSTLDSNFTHKHTFSKSKIRLNVLIMVCQHYKMK